MKIISRSVKAVVVLMALLSAMQFTKNYTVVAPKHLSLSNVTSLRVVKAGGYNAPPFKKPIYPPKVLSAPKVKLPAPVSLSGISTDYTFMDSTSTHPFKWNKNIPIHYVTNTKEALPGALADVQKAFSIISLATGLHFIYDGATSSYPQDNWATTSSSSTGYAPIIVAWATANQSSVLSYGNAGTGGPDSVDSTYVSGEAVLSVADQNLFAAGFGKGETRGNLLLHELGHVMGLDHAKKPGEIMDPIISSATPNGYGKGDLAGFKVLYN